MNSEENKKMLEELLYSATERLYSAIDPTGVTRLLAKCLHDTGVSTLDIPKFIRSFYEGLEQLDAFKEKGSTLIPVDDDILRAIRREQEGEL